jgi:NAD(P)-dependent dehydrogenase (short-subunit alcohol dehydrogenase family)
MDKESLGRLHDLTGRVAIVTGGTRGIGLAIAEGLSAAGASVAVASRKVDACRRVQSHLRSMGGEAVGVPTHMGDLESVNALVHQCVEEFGRIDVVVNNAANALTQPFGQLTASGWEKSLDTNLSPDFSVIRC